MTTATPTLPDVDADYWIRHLELLPHPEGGFYRQTYRSPEHVTDTTRFAGDRLLSTSIYFLLNSHDVSHFHRLKSDELWYFHAGSPLTIYVIHPSGDLELMKLGLDFINGEVPQALVPKGCIFGSAVNEDHSFSLVGCMVSPGFEFEDFELFSRDHLLADYPQHKDIIERLTPTPSVAVSD